MPQRAIALMLPLFFLAAGASGAAAQQQTERYIPIGHSPGISGKYAYLGQIIVVDVENRTVTVEGESGSRTIRIAEETRIWLDRSRLRQTTVPGTFRDLEVGQTVEVKYTDNERRDTADWVKVGVR